MEFLIIGIVTAVNLLVIKVKLERKRIEDAVLDLSLMITVVILFSGSYGGMVVAMIASMVISLYLFANPPKFTKSLAKSSVLSEAKTRFKSELSERLRKDKL